MMDDLDRLIQAAFETGLPAVVRMHLRDAVSLRTDEPLTRRVEIALTAIEGRGLDLIAADIRALLPPEGGAVVTP